MTTDINLNYPVVDPNGPELAEGVYRQNNMTVWEGGQTAYITMLGYIVQIWSRLMHRAWAGNRYPKSGITGDYIFDASELASQAEGKEWRVSNVGISIDRYPSKGNIIFGNQNLIHAGYFSWLRSTFSNDGLDWQLVPDAGGSGFQTTGFIGFDLALPFGSALTPPLTFNETGVLNLATTGGEGTTGGTAKNGAWDLQLQSQITYQVGASSFGGNKPNVIAAGVSQVKANNGQKYMYPLQWLNWEKMWFEAPDPNVNGFVLKLKPGVIATINVGLTTRDPQVSYVSGESSVAAFNPMKGGAI